MLEIELYSQIKTINLASEQGCLEKAPDHICEKTLVIPNSFWITCLAAALDILDPPLLESEKRVNKVFKELAKNDSLKID